MAESVSIPQVLDTSQGRYVNVNLQVDAQYVKYGATNVKSFLDGLQGSSSGGSGVKTFSIDSSSSDILSNVGSSTNVILKYNGTAGSGSSGASQTFDPSVEITGDLIPAVSGQYNVGSASRRWLLGCFNHIALNGHNIKARVIYTKSTGTSNPFVVPYGVTTLYISGCGAGGGGAVGAGGGGGECLFQQPVSVATGQRLDIIIGHGGQGSSYCSNLQGIGNVSEYNGDDGGDTIIRDQSSTETILINLSGGKGGFYGNYQNGTAVPEELGLELMEGTLLQDIEVGSTGTSFLYSGGKSGGPGGSNGEIGNLIWFNAESQNVSINGNESTKQFLSGISGAWYRGGRGGSTMFGVGGAGAEQMRNLYSYRPAQKGQGYGAGGGGGSLTWWTPEDDDTRLIVRPAASGSDGLVIIEWV